MRKPVIAGNWKLYKTKVKLLNLSRSSPRSSSRRKRCRNRSRTGLYRAD